jgi:hypothetical protein
MRKLSRDTLITHRPENPATSMNGRVVYENRDFISLSANQMRKAGEKFAEAFPEYEIWVTGGPYRGCDVMFVVDEKAKVISLDFYSVNPGLDDIDSLIVQCMKQLRDHKSYQPDIALVGPH